ncbi:MAG: hypothetical protein GTO45_21175 [Candidatus Aminicenantes bacterium]|nr:hypothetical protein [Candidatus Aminicenantes bacterium]NIM81275.1 hypothetical protein [Candidatus Aminicenantes bacterium]NIN20677.1 hypothetical protein [Candidatus Aminicenantes bacterium]NIN44453.1 hypothetical protein [Candidatus Aminicenantes bacterium]NIN87275.1 hypothetical protein [Candidatus Aminicenantes bacterium]
MKKKINNKLVLNKKTIANLGLSEMKQAKGGDYTDDPCLPSAGCTPDCPSDQGAVCAPETAYPTGHSCFTICWDCWVSVPGFC